MNRDAHTRAEQLILESRVGAISRVEMVWLESHLRTCDECADRAQTADEAIRALRSMTIRLDPNLVAATRVRIHARAHELRAQRLPRAWLWASCALSWGWIAVCAPRLWRGFGWVAEKVGVPSPLWEMAFALWWAVPALIIAATLGARSLGGADSITER